MADTARMSSARPGDFDDGTKESRCFIPETENSSKLVPGENFTRNLNHYC